MVLESVLRSRFALKHPISAFFFGIVHTVASAGISLATFPNSASVLSVALITMGAMPLFYRAFKHEEHDETSHPQNPATFVSRHFHLIALYGFFFLGLIAANTFLYAELPVANRELLFHEQEATYGQIEKLRGNVTGADTDLRIEKLRKSFPGADGGATPCQQNQFIPLALGCIFANNAMVLGWTLVLSLLYGAGALFLIAWNATVIAVVLGREVLATNAVNAFGKLGCLIPHGVPELAAYFIGAIAGGLISVAVANKLYKRPQFKIILQDVLVLVILAYILLFIGSLIEAGNILSACFTR
ncbi:MAG: stage II sporulation protein M [Candidatus Diapherotrites archaeon]|nr:stage II sporulation protein M [Candidatus Diapherotrites archaeon]